MTDVMGSSFGDVHLSKDILTLFHDGNWFIIASTVGAYSLWHMLLSILADGSTIWPPNALYDRRSSTINIAFHGILVNKNPNMG